MLARRPAVQRRENFVSDCISLLDGGTNLLAIRGQSGTGKSTLMARLAQVLQDRGHQVLPIFCSTTPLCNNSLDLVKYIIDDLEDRLAWPHFCDSAPKWSAHGAGVGGPSEDLVAAYNAQEKGRLIILIDGVTSSSPTRGGRNCALSPTTCPLSCRWWSPAFRSSA